MNERIIELRRRFAETRGRRLAVRREACFRAFGPESIAHAMRSFSDAMDRAVQQACRFSFALARAELGREGAGLRAPQPGLAAVAVGGYGRRQLAPYSDVDLAVVVPDEGDPLVQAAAKHLYYLLIDALHRGLGVEDGYAYYNLSQPLLLDERALSALLDARLVCGDPALYRALDEEIFRRLDGPRFQRWNYRTRQGARERAGGVVHVQEPNLKESAGGLRDLQCALWSAAAVWRRKPAEVLDHLVALGAVSEAQAAAAHRAQDFMWALRCRLHLQAGRKRDVLALDSHLAVARAFGFLGADGEPSPNALMAAYYREAETTERLSRQLFGLCEAARIGLGHGFYVHEGALWTRNAPRLEGSASLVMRALELAGRYELEPARSLVAALERAVPAVRAQNASPEAAASFLTLLRSGPRAARVLRIAEAAGVLQAYLPEVGEALRWSSGEAVHEYTVGEHLLRTVERLRLIERNEGDEFAGPAGVYAELDRPEILVLAALLHDVGRIEPGRDHCHVGEDIARRTAQRIGMSPGDAEAVAQLVRRHLLLDRVATLRDVSEERTIHHVAERVGTVDALKRLYLLTCADIMAVGSGLWTDVRRDQLEDLYYRVLSHLLDDSPVRASQEDLTRLRERATDTLIRSGKLSVAAVRRHCRAMPDAYFLGTPIGLIGVHVSLIGRLAEEQTVIDFYDDDATGYTELTVCRYDDARPGLFARLCAALYANDVDIHDARIYTRPDQPPIALDTLWVTWQGRRVPEQKAESVRADLREVLDGSLAAEALLHRKNRPRPTCLHIRRLKADNAVARHHTVFEVEGRDQLGFLFCVSAALSSLSLNIHTAKITTRGVTAEDAFYVTNAAGEKLADAEAAATEQALFELLGCEEPDSGAV